jgi:hypothetical protein
MSYFFRLWRRSVRTQRTKQNVGIVAMDCVCNSVMAISSGRSHTLEIVAIGRDRKSAMAILSRHIHTLVVVVVGWTELAVMEFLRG